MFQYVELFKIGSHRVTYGTIMLFMYVAFYIKMDPFLGSIFSVVLLLFYMQANHVVGSELAFEKTAAAKRGGSTVKKGVSWFKIAFALQAFGWYMQIHPGHAIFEGVKPALVDSLGQALGVAPFFGFLEGLWAAGLRPELKERVLVLVAENRAAMCVAGQKMPWC